MSKDDKVSEPSGRKVWQPPQLAYLGDVEELVQISGGGGKISITAADPGEPRKTKPSE